MNFSLGQVTEKLQGNNTTGSTINPTNTMTMIDATTTTTLNPATSLLNNNNHVDGLASAVPNGAAALKMDSVIVDMMSAIDLLPDEKKSSFLKAKRLCPNLVQAETSPAMFLKFDNFNYWKAAERLAMHWTEREAIFGERAFLPMTQTGNGALTKDDVVTLHTGSHARLASTPSGQPVIFTDRRRILSSSNRASRLRCFWYLVFHVAREENAAKYGILFLALVVTPRPSPLDVSYMQQGVQILKLMPATFHMHLLNNVSKTGKFSVAQKLIQTVASYCLQFFGGLGIVTESCQGDLKEKLMGLGCVPEGLPASVGGSWKYEEYTRWCRRRITEELYFEELHVPSNKSESTRKMTAERKKERTKSLNVLHSRQKRERRKAEQVKMEADCSQLQRQYFALKKENVRLEDLLLQAKRIVQQYEGNGGFSLPTGMPNSFDPIPTNVLSTNNPAPVSFEPQNSMGMQGNQFQMLGTLAMQQNLNQQGMNQPLPNVQNMQPNNSMNHSMNQLGNQVVQFAGTQSLHAQMQNMNQSEMNQQFINELWSNQQHNSPGNPMAPMGPMGQGIQQTSIPHANTNLSVQQAMMQAMAMPNALNQNTAQTMSQQSVQRNVDNTMLTQNNLKGPPPGMLSTTTHAGPSPTQLECPNADPFAPLDAHIGPSTATNVPASAPFVDMQHVESSFVPDAAPGPVPLATTLRDSVPQEFTGFDIEPDPIAETHMGIPGHLNNLRNQFF